MAISLRYDPAAGFRYPLMKLLIIEDNPDILANLADYLGLRGYLVDCAADGLTGLHLAATQRFDLIILDLMLPGLDGFALCSRLREGNHGSVPIIMLTARDTLEDRLRGFGAGADDYLTKPFALPELAARVAAILKRSRGGGRRELHIGGLRYDLDALEVSRDGVVVHPGPTGFKLLEVLMRKSPAVVRREVLEETLWGDSPPHSDSLRSHIHALRQQIDKPFLQPLIHTVHGIGYRLSET